MHACLPAPPKPQPRALSEAERAGIPDLLHSQRFVDKAPAQVYAELLDDRVYVTRSTRLPDSGRRRRVRERRRQATHPAKANPELCAQLVIGWVLGERFLKHRSGTVARRCGPAGRAHTPDARTAAQCYLRYLHLLYLQPVPTELSTQALNQYAKLASTARPSTHQAPRYSSSLISL
jgi:hypothetical protein